MSSLVSNANEENVVNPPQNPTFKNNIIFGFIELCFAARAAIIPIKKEPIRFIRNVFIGKADPSFNGMVPMKYLLTAPINPPIPTII